MLTFILYVFAAMTIAFVYKFAVGLVSVLFGLAVMAAMGFKERKIELLLLKHPKKFVAFAVLEN